MDIYRIIGWYRRIESPRLKLLGILALHVLRRRYLYIALDPSLACNLRCRMCYFSNSETEQSRSTFSEEDLRQIARSVFHRGLKLQIGDGAEPTTYKGVAQLVKMAHDSGIPHISMSTNGNLMTSELLQQLAANGLTELIVSCHGLDKETYEGMMRYAKFERFERLISDVGTVRQQYPALRLRINYTICADNIESLSHFNQVFAKVKPDIVQLRPVQDTGSTAYDNYSMEPLVEKYDRCIRPVVSYCQANDITCLYPEADNLNAIAKDNAARHHYNAAINMLPFFHLSPHATWKEEFNPYEETFEQYSKRTHRVRFILKNIIRPQSNHSQDGDVTKALNYHIK